MNGKPYHYHGVAKFPIAINDPRCPVCNSDGRLSDAQAKCRCTHTGAEHVFAKCTRCECKQFKPAETVEAVNL